MMRTYSPASTRPGGGSMTAETDALPVDVAVGRALRAAVHEHVMFTETEGGFFDGRWGISGAYHWCACGWRSDDGPWRDAETYVHGMAQAREDHLSNAMFAAVRDLVRDLLPRQSGGEVAALRKAIDAAHDEQRQALDAGRGDETLTLFQHWSATAGWLTSRIRGIERVGEADWPDAVRYSPGQTP